MSPTGGKNRALSCNISVIQMIFPALGSEKPMSDTLIAGGALLVASIALVMSVVSNLRGYSLQQRMLDLERRMGKETGPGRAAQPREE